MIKKILFSLFFFSGIIFISLIFLPTIFLPKAVVLFGGKIMGYWTAFCLQIFLSTKKELLKIPLFGWYLKKIGSISIKRNKTSKENLSFFDDISKQVNSSDRPIIIFPQGTRLPPDDRTPFKKGSSRIYEELKISCQPIAINSGYVWPKRGLKISNKVITISILKPIKVGLRKEEFIKILENSIYEELNQLN